MAPPISWLLGGLRSAVRSEVQVAEELASVGAEVGDSVLDSNGEVGSTRDLELLALAVGLPFTLTRRLLHVPAAANEEHPLLDGGLERPVARLHDANGEVALLVHELEAANLSVEVIVLSDHVISPCGCRR